MFCNAIVRYIVHASTLSKKLFSNLASSVSDNPKRLWQTINKLLHRKAASPLPTSVPGSSLADSFANFLTYKISKLHISLTSNASTSYPHSPSPPTEPSNFSSFRPASESEISNILFNCPNKQPASDPTPTRVASKCMCFCPYSYHHQQHRESVSPQVSSILFSKNL